MFGLEFLKFLQNRVLSFFLEVSFTGTMRTGKYIYVFAVSIYFCMLKSAFYFLGCPSGYTQSGTCSIYGDDNGRCKSSGGYCLSYIENNFNLRFACCIPPKGKLA